MTDSLRSFQSVPDSPTSPKSPSILEQELLSSADEVLQQCPKMRILVLGKSGAGKSSLINATFDVDLAHVSHEKAGISNIETEITSDQNPRFVLHDSQGFAAGEVQNFNTVVEFIEKRANMPELKDKLHAIWFCMEVPTENAALFERADQNFLNLKLENVPIIVVFTKYDLLVRKLERETEFDESMDEREFESLIDNKAEAFYHDICVEPLKAITKGRSPPIQYVRVSKKPRYHDTLVELVDTTRAQLDESMWLIWATAQRANADLNIEACIEVGRRKYWSGLASSLHFPGKTLRKCLDVIHGDIVKVWNFYDPSLHLESADFKSLMYHLTDDLSDYPSTRIREFMSVTGVLGLVTAAIPPAIPFVLPVAAGLVFAQWVFMVYQESPIVLRLLMGYIVDLTMVMHSLFWITRARGEAMPVHKKLLRLAYVAYCDSGSRTRVHNDIRHFVRSTSTLNRHQKANVVDELKHLIETYKFVPPKMRDMVSVSEEGDLNEEWYFHEDSETHLVSPRFGTL